MGKKSNKKGRELEDALESIEKAILENCPELKTGNWQLTPRKRLTIKGVRYEIDLLVEVTAGPHKSIFIYECKNWKKSVGRKEISDFADKIEAVGATKGYFVAKQYSKDARKKASDIPRMRLLDVSSRIPDAVKQILLSVMSIRTHNIKIQFLTVIPEKAGLLNNLDVNSSNVISEGQSTPFLKFYQQYLDEIMEVEKGIAGELKNLVGIHNRRKFYKVENEGEPISINGVEIRELIFDVSYSVDIQSVPISYAYNVEGRGSVCISKPAKIGGIEDVSFRVTTREKSPK